REQRRAEQDDGDESPDHERLQAGEHSPKQAADGERKTSAESRTHAARMAHHALKVSPHSHVTRIPNGAHATRGRLSLHCPDRSDAFLDNFSLRRPGIPP